MMAIALERRLTVEAVAPSAPESTFAVEVRRGLTAQPKQLPCRFFYDHQGSRIFEQICDLPEYYLTRAEQEILTRHADEIAAAMPVATMLVELGSGSAAKTRRLIEAFLRRQEALRYVPIDIARGMLEASARQLLADYPALVIHAVAAEYRDGLRRLQHLRHTAEADRPRLVLWLGSNVGNFERDEAAAFLAQVRTTLGPDDRLLVGVDLRKDRAVLEPAYDDAQGVTACFNKNLLDRINRELGGHFDLEAFDHRAIYAEDAGRIEMYLVSRRAQTAPIDGLELRVPFAAGEAIHTENSYKYSLDEIRALAAAAGLVVERQWLDGDRRFSECLFRPAGASPAGTSTWGGGE
ncbi:MAG: L-histidine N(alpha)-methyltransferase [Chloroflexota bacterium]